MSGPIYNVISRSYDRTVRREWKCAFSSRSGTRWKFVGEFESEVTHSDLGIIRRGTVSEEYYWIDRCYSIFRFIEPGGSFRSFYCNLNLPPAIGDGVVGYIDLDIDVVIWPDGRVDILDIHEFAENSVRLGYDMNDIAAAGGALRELLSAIEGGSFGSFLD